MTEQVQTMNSISRVGEIRAVMARLRAHVRYHRSLFVAYFVLATSVAFFETAGIGLIIPMISLMGSAPEAVNGNPVIRYASRILPGRSASEYVWIFGLVIIAAIVTKNVLTVLNRYIMARLTCELTSSLRESFFDSLSRAHMDVFDTRNSGDILNAFGLEVGRTRNFVELLLILCQLGVVTAFYATGLFLLSWPFMVGVLLTVAIAGYINAVRFRRITVQSGLQVSSGRKLMGYLGDVFSGFRVVRGNGAESQCREGFMRRNDELIQYEERSAFVSGTLLPVTETVIVTGTILLLIQSNSWLIQTGRLSVEGLMTLGLGLVRMFPLVNQFYTLIGQALYYSGGVVELLRWLELPRFPEKPFGDATLGPVRQSIRIDHVTVEYPGGKKGIDDVSLEIPAGRTVALVGASGSGKTTLASVLLRLRAPSSGSIRVDGVDYWRYSPSSWHRSVRMVEQGAFLLNDSIRANILLGSPDATEEQLKAALSLAYLDPVIGSLPEGVDSPVGEGGALLSGGQRQRVSIARAMVQNPSVLILDEATSALDNVSEREVQLALDRVRVGRTVIVIAHRLRTVRDADLVVVLEQGRIVEQGTWNQLTQKQGKFSELVAASQLHQ
ncbi:MAG: ABC transporter ATP-binding protein [Verrucomicrobia bacterium]|nr:ABC transporter ATP-binding protein [Verrucomicrobiota bacterium]